MMLATAVAVPSFVKSMKGAKLRTSARTVATVNKYARGMSVLKQKQMALLFDSEQARLELVSIVDKTAGNNMEKFLDGHRDSGLLQRSGEEGEEQGPNPYGVESETIKKLAEGVQIIHLKSDAEIPEVDGIYYVNYYPNGMCDPFTIELTDDRGKTVTVEVNGATGRAKVEFE